MHDYSRDIMLANAQTEMEATMAKMELAKMDNITRQNNNKSSSMKKDNDNLGYMFLPSAVSISMIWPNWDLVDQVFRIVVLS